MKKIFNVILLILSIFIIASCNKKVDERLKDEIVKTNFINNSEEYEISDNVIDLYYFKDDALSYVEVRDYLNLLDGIYYSDNFEYIINMEEENILINFEVTSNLESVNYQMIIDSKTDEIRVNSEDFFYAYLKETETNFSEGLINLEPVYTKGSGITYNLSEYDFDIKLIEDNFIMPLPIINLIFNQGNYFDTFFNGDVIYGIDTAYMDDLAYKEILKSSYNNKKETDQMKLDNYNFYLFVIDYFYGLKEERNIFKAKDYINKEEFLKEDSNKSIFNITMKLDDLHSSHRTKGYINNNLWSLTFNSKNLGPNTKNFYDGMDMVVDSAFKHFGVKNGYLNLNDMDFEYINNNETLIIYILEFDVDTPVKLEEVIKNAKVETKNIVIDLSLNTGGNLGAVLRMFSLFTNDEIWYHAKNPLTNEKVSYGVKGEKSAYDNYKYYFKQSSVTFSAANLAISIAKELNIKTLGQKSSGGASSIGFFIFPNGSVINLSSNMVLTNKKYESIEYGLSPDYYLVNIYDENEIKISIN